MLKKIINRVSKLKYKRSYFNNLIYPVILILICFYLAIANHIPGSYLSGWDTLHPEFNFPLNFQRLIFGVFRSEQGLGAVAAHSHMADLPRTFLLYLSSFLLPLNLLRYSFISLFLTIGVLGIYFFIDKILLISKRHNSHPSAFLGALFYLLNLGTLQHFHVPFEMFAVQFAFLPWLFLSTINYIQQATFFRLFFFGAVTLMSTPMAYAATLWYAFLLSFILFLLPFVKKNFSKIIRLIVLTLLINAFWLLPNLYFVFSGNAKFVPEARINKIFSEEAYSYNKNFGDLKDTIIFKNFLFDWAVYQGEDRFGYLMQVWKTYLSKWWISAIGYLNFIVIVTGLIICIRWKNRYGLALIIPTIFSLIFIANLSFPIDQFFNVIRNNSDIFREALRFPFTKFSIILIFSFSVLYAFGQSYLINTVNKVIKNNSARLILPSLFIFLLVTYMWPAFKGNFVSPYLQVKIPDEYFQMFKWFDEQPADARIGVLPIHSLWGWTYYDWGFQGAQFVSFGIKQPLLDRDYDRWNINNENYYRQMSYAIYSQNKDIFEKLLSKYKIHYLVVDKNILAPGSYQDKKVLFFDEIEALLNSSAKVKLANQYKNISVYQVDTKNDLIDSSGRFINIPTQYGFQDIDWPYIDNGDYISDLSNNSKYSQHLPKTYYPFANLIDNQNLINKDLKIVDDKISLSNIDIPKKALINLNSYLEDESYLSADLYLKKALDGVKLKLVLKTPSTQVSPVSRELNYSLGKINTPLSDWLVNIDEFQTFPLKDTSNDDYVFQDSILLSTKTFNNITFYKSTSDLVETASKQQFKLSDLSQHITNCGDKNSNEIESLDIPDTSTITIEGKNAKVCLRVPLTDIVTKNQNLVTKELLKLGFTVNTNNNVLGHYCIYDKNRKRCIKERKDLKNLSQTEEYVLINENNHDKLELVLFLDAVDKNELVKISYSDLHYFLLAPTDIVSISPIQLEDIVKEEIITLEKNGKLLIPTSNKLLANSTYLFEQGHKSSSCSSIDPKSYSRFFNRDYIEYSSEKGSSCDYFEFSNLPHNSGYLLEIETQNVNGLPLRICIANNYSKRCDLYLSLPQNKQFSKNLLLIPSNEDGGAGYNIHLNNYSVENTVSTNRVKGLKVLEFPNIWLGKLKLSEPSHTINSKAKIDNSSQVIPGVYRVNFDNQSSTPGLIKLNKSFDVGWWMSKGEHVHVNGWANGWLIGPNSKGTTWIIYLPQVLEIAGLGILLVLITYSFLIIFISLFFSETT